MDDRDKVIADLSYRPLDVLVVGGGILGAGVARDAAMRNLRVGLVEQNDFASGTSSRSSRLLHGGLRYLAQGRIGLVRQAGREKKNIHEIAPHLAVPLPFIFPAYRKSGWPLLKLRVGVGIYHLLAGGVESYDRSGRIPDDELGAMGLDQHNLTGGVRYFDSFTNDARLVLDTLRSAHRHRALLLNYLRLDDARRKNGMWTCTITDTVAQRTFDVQGRCVVNAAGPWADRFRESSLKLRLTKGVHLVIPHDRLPISQAVVIAESLRILFAIPWGDRVILGTTDTDYTADPEAVQTAPADVAYLLEHVNRAFPQAQLRESDVNATWAGLRPLIADGKSDHPSDISRHHLIRLHDGWVDVAGGKLTTYRLIAEQTVQTIARYLDLKPPPSRTAQEPLVSASEAEGISSILPPPPAHDLVRHYCEHEWAEHLDDVMIRRTNWAYYMPQAESLAQQVADWMSQILGWDEARRTAELSRLRTPQLV